MPQKNFRRGNFRPGYNQYNGGFMLNNFTPTHFYGCGRGNRGFFGKFGSFPRGYGYQGNIVYHDTTTTTANAVGVVSSLPIYFSLYKSGLNNATAFNYYNGVNDGSKFNQTSSVSIFPPLEAV